MLALFQTSYCYRECPSKPVFYIRYVIHTERDFLKIHISSEIGRWKSRTFYWEILVKYLKDTLEVYSTPSRTQDHPPHRSLLSTMTFCAALLTGKVKTSIIMRSNSHSLFSGKVLLFFTHLWLFLKSIFDSCDSQLKPCRAGGVVRRRVPIPGRSQLSLAGILDTPASPPRRHTPPGPEGWPQPVPLRDLQEATTCHWQNLQEPAVTFRKHAGNQAIQLTQSGYICQNTHSDTLSLTHTQYSLLANSPRLSHAQWRWRHWLCHTHAMDRVPLCCSRRPSQTLTEPSVPHILEWGKQPLNGKPGFKSWSLSNKLPEEMTSSCFFAMLTWEL